MDFKQLLKQIEELQQVNDEESYKKIIELVDQYLNSVKHKGILSAIIKTKGVVTPANIMNVSETAKEEKNTKEEIEQLELIRENAVVKLMEFEYAKLPETDKKNRIHMQGKMIKEYKKLENMENIDTRKFEVRHRRIELLEQQKNLMKDYRQTADDIKLPEKVSLKVKEISDSIKIFLGKKDIILKIKNILKETSIAGVSSAVLIMAIGIIVALVTGLPTAFVGLSTMLPIIGYSALTSTMRNFSSKSGFQQFEFFRSDEFKKYLDEFKENNKEALKEFDSLLKEKSSCTKPEEVIQINEAIIQKISEITKNIKFKGFRDTYEIQALALMRENKECCKHIINEYLNEKNNDKEKYKKYNKKLGDLNLKIFAKENSFKDALNSASKNVVKNTAIMALAKTIITAVVPQSSIAIHGIHSFIIPVAIAITNGLVELSTYSGKLKYKEASKNKKIDSKEKNRFGELFGLKSLAIA